MSTTQLKAAATSGTQVAKADKPKTIAGLLTDPSIKNQMALALPKHMTADRLARIALTEVRKNPKLAQCDQTSFLGAIMQCAALGLEPGGALGHVYMLPFDKRKKVGQQWQVVATEVQLIVGYRGMLDLARRSGQILSLEARAVYERDFFKVTLGLESNITHEPDWQAADRGKVTFVYAVAKLRDGGIQFEVMSAAEIHRIRDESQGYKSALESAKKYNKEASSPWISNFDEMAKKTVIRRLFKYLPVSIEIQRAVGLDEQADLGLTQDTPITIEGDYSTVTPEIGHAHDEHGGDAGGITAQDIHDALAAASTRSELDQAADLISLLPEDQRKPLLDQWNARCSEITE
jgi:recombination protein RecT